MRLLGLVLLLALLAFFVASEFALIRLRPTRVQELAENGSYGALAVERLQRHLRRALVATQLGVSLSLLALGWSVHKLLVGLASNGIHPYLELLVFFSLAIFATLLGGVLPKAWVLRDPEASALRIGPLLEAVNRCLTPLLAPLERLAEMLLLFTGLPREWDRLVPALSAGELENLIENDAVTGLEPDERNILEGVFSLRDTQVREVMVPRNGMVTLPLGVSFAELMQAVLSTNHARFPVIGDSLDDVRGLLDLRLLAEPLSRGELQPHTPLAAYIRNVERIQESASLAELLPMIRNGEPLLVVVDEHGGTEGLVTIADLTGEIVGDELLEDDGSPPDLQPLGKDLWLVAGDLEIFELNRQLGLKLPEADGHHTLAGFLLERLQHIPTPGEALRWGGHHFEVLTMDGPRIEEVKIWLGHRENAVIMTPQMD
ncbi:MAG: HlyC/CorC family transporter [Synechococcaceae bacterium WBA_2_066]|nr:HlyC/CorC family transporter [Synechococcaceae bacterium WB6_1A_059]NBR44723.1 HlyC/CorC family transporter [Synechococcaceae bacterium WB5_2B_268]NBY60047.1 HlyC/CorC family transporter [Synechococcaceae bacterium LLD_019]NCU75571.1 HlyC/CorC family transporter [Synechococcaceae bacterium WB7_1C_051]NCU90731.1 HlyC/CorC family transporter [Synechococcaceae bacterium WB7_1B_046]NCY13719.1 HlyC/CorC family transporter [Synechococcaceae bacterium WB8_1A_041]NDC05978.1 HlyC/CorC family transp